MAKNWLICQQYTELRRAGFCLKLDDLIYQQEVEPEPDRIWILNWSHITGSGLPDSVDPAQYPDLDLV